MANANGTGGGPSMLTGAHNLAFAHADFRAAGRDMYMPVVNISFTGGDPSIPPGPSPERHNERPSCPSTLQCHASVATNTSGTRDKRGLRWRISRFLIPALHQTVKHEQVIEVLHRSEDRPSPKPNSGINDRPEQPIEVFAIEEQELGTAEPRELTTPEVYVRSMLPSGKGLACWQPEPQCDDVGVEPGDVGVYSAGDGFNKLFNLWDDAAALNKRAFFLNEPAYHPPVRDLRLRKRILREGDTVVQGATSRTSLGMADGRTYVSSFEFHCRSPRGAVLALTSSADLHEATDHTELRDCIIAHARLLYRHANAIRRIGLNESLSITTGCIKSERWALAAYRDPMMPPYDSLRLVQTSRDVAAGGTAYAWTDRGTSEARSGGGIPGGKNQCLFLRGFRLSFSREFHTLMKATSSSHMPADRENGNEHPPSYDPENRGPDGDERGGQGSHRDYSGANSLDGPSFGGAPSRNGGTVEAECGAQVESFPADRPEIYHPSETINRFLLEKIGSQLALSHDDDWVVHAGRSDWDVSPSYILQNVTSNRVCGLRKGLAFLATPARTGHSPIRADTLLLRYLFAPGALEPEIRQLNARFDVEIFSFSPPAVWHSSPLPSELVLPVRLGPNISGEQHSRQVHAFLDLDLPLQSIRNLYGLTVISYNMLADDQLGVLSDGQPLYWQSIFQGPADTSLILLSVMWHICRAWDVGLEVEYIELGATDVQALSPEDIVPLRLGPYEDIFMAFINDLSAFEETLCLVGAGDDYENPRWKETAAVLQKEIDFIYEEMYYLTVSVLPLPLQRLERLKKAFRAVTFSTYLDFQPSDSEEGVSEYGAEVEELSRRLDPWRFEPELVGFERYFVDPGDSGLTTPPVTAGRVHADAGHRDSSASKSPGRTKGDALDEGKNKSDVAEEGSTKRLSTKTTEGKNRLVDKRTVDSAPSSTSSQPVIGPS